MVDIEQINKELGKIPQHPLSETWEEIYDEMKVHTQGSIPEDLLRTRRPNEDPAVHEYRMEIYQPITKGSINRAIDQLHRIFFNTNHSITTSEDLAKYLNTKTFNRQNFQSYLQRDVLRRMVEDPNGLLIWIPSGMGLTDPSEKVDPVPMLIYSSQILVMEEDHIIIHASGDHGSRIFWTLDDQAIYIHTERSGGGGFSWQLVYEHNIGEVPAVILGGNLVEGGYFESYFSPFLPFGNESIRVYSDWQAVMVTSAFPYREEVADDCDSPACHNGQIPDHENDESDWRDCPKCNGTGLKRQHGPYGVFTRPRANGALENVDPRPSISFISPPHEIINVSKESWQDLLKKAEEALHLHFIDQAQSGVAKLVDREDKYSFLGKVCATVFDGHMLRSLWLMERYRNITAPQDPTVTKPSNFTVKTEEDLVNEITALKEKNAPSPFIIEATKDLARKRFNGNATASRMVDVIVAYDPIFHLTIEEKNQLLAGDGISRDMLVKSTHAYSLLMEIIDEQGPEVLEESLTQIKARLDEKVAPLLAQGSRITLFE